MEALLRENIGRKAYLVRRSNDHLIIGILRAVSEGKIYIESTRDNYMIDIDEINSVDFKAD